VKFDKSRKFNDQFTFLAYLDLKKDYDLVLMHYINLTKLNIINIGGKCLQFITKSIP